MPKPTPKACFERTVKKRHFVMREVDGEIQAVEVQPTPAIPAKVRLQEKAERQRRSVLAEAIRNIAKRVTERLARLP